LRRLIVRADRYILVSVGRCRFDLAASLRVTDGGDHVEQGPRRLASGFDGEDNKLLR